MLRVLFVICAVLFVRASQAQTSREWNSLLHYQKNLLTGWISEVQNSDFFISPSGRSDPQAELQASLSVLAANGVLHGQPFKCVFPARYQYLKTTFALKIQEPECPELEKWKTRFAADSATVVFATAYLGNVASSFGHTFLKINSTPGRFAKDELLNLGLSYAAANSPDDNPIAFAWKGLTGGYFESLTTMPYFTRLSQYHNIENRDVWEYRLKLTPEQVDLLLDHVWELRTAQMKYYFFNKNCAYHLWALLEVADPSLPLTEAVSYSAIPSDGIKVLSRSGAVARVEFRPSTYHKLKQKISAMTDREKSDFTQSVAANLALTGEESSLVLEALLDYQQFTSERANRELLPEDKSKQEDLFLKLTSAKISDRSLPNIEAASQPDLGQASRKLSLLYSRSQGDSSAALEFRPTFHDLLDNDEGYTPFSQFIAGLAQVRYSENQSSVNLEKFDLIDVISLTPVDAVLRAPSWMIRAGALVPPDSSCKTCLSAQTEFGLGFSRYLMPSSENLMSFAFLKFDLQAGSGTAAGFRWGPDELFGLVFRLGRWGKVLTEVELTQYFPQLGPYADWTTGLSWSALPSLELRFNGVWRQVPNQNYELASLGLGYYF